MNLTHLLSSALLPSSFPLPLDAPFTYRTALRESGLDSRDLRWLVDNSFLWRPIKGVYAATQLPDSLELRCHALRLVVPEDAVVCDRHAGWLHGAEMVLAPNEHLHLSPVTVFLPAGRGRLRNALADSGERAFRRRDLTDIGGMRVTTPLRTACDLGRTRWPERSLAALDQMLRLGAFAPAELLSEVARFRGMRWVRTLRAMAPLSDGRAESPPESVLRLRWIQASLPEPVPQLQVWHGGEFIARLDLANERLRFGAEYNGVEWHSTPEQVESDRKRQRLLEERADWMITTFVKKNVFGPHQDAEARLRQGVTEARRRLGGRAA